MTPVEVIACFQAAQEVFVAITEKPTDKDIVRIQEILTPIPLSIPYDESEKNNNLWGLIASTEDYTARYSNASLVALVRPPIYLNVVSDAIAPIRADVEFKNAAKLVDFNVHATTECGYHDFIKAAVEDTKHATTFYVGVNAIEFLAHLQKHCGGLHALNMVDFQVDIRLYYANAAGIQVHHHAQGLSEEGKACQCPHLQ